MGKKYSASLEKVGRNKIYTLEEAIKAAKEIAWTKFDESVDLAVRLGVDPRHSDQMVRGAVVLPHGTGKSVKVITFAKGEKEREAREAGSEFVGGGEIA